MLAVTCYEAFAFPIKRLTCANQVNFNVWQTIWSQTKFTLFTNDTLIKLNFIDLSIYAWKTCKQHKAKMILFTEFPNVTNLVTFVKPCHYLAKRSFNTIQISNLNQKSA